MMNLIDQYLYMTKDVVIHTAWIGGNCSNDRGYLTLGREYREAVYSNHVGRRSF